jgi:hypothetical protein
VTPLPTVVGSLSVMGERHEMGKLDGMLRDRVAAT